ncbi:hypothetical protein Agub_g3698, partial [Astrephomene gubernaculifera]
MMPRFGQASMRHDCTAAATSSHASLSSHKFLQLRTAPASAVAVPRPLASPFLNHMGAKRGEAIVPRVAAPAPPSPMEAVNASAAVAPITTIAAGSSSGYGSTDRQGQDTTGFVPGSSSSSSTGIARGGSGGRFPGRGGRGRGARGGRGGRGYGGGYYGGRTAGPDQLLHATHGSVLVAAGQQGPVVVVPGELEAMRQQVARLTDLLAEQRQRDVELRRQHWELRKQLNTLLQSFREATVPQPPLPPPAAAAAVPTATATTITTTAATVNPAAAAAPTPTPDAVATAAAVDAPVGSTAAVPAAMDLPSEEAVTASAAAVATPAATASVSTGATWADEVAASSPVSAPAAAV